MLLQQGFTGKLAKLKIRMKLDAGKAFPDNGPQLFRIIAGIRMDAGKRKKTGAGFGIKMPVDL